MKSYLLAAVACVAMMPAAASAAVSFGGPVTVPNDPGTGAAGVTVALTNASVDDALQFTVSGTPFLQPSNSYGVNAAGVVTVVGPEGSMGIGGSTPDGFSGFTYGSLIATFTSGNFTRTVQVFAPDTGNGSGSMNPPTSLTYTGTLNNLFNYTGRATTVNGTLNFRVDDSGYDDNSGSFSITQATAAVPEPATWAMMMLGFGGMGYAMRRKSKVRARVRFI